MQPEPQVHIAGRGTKPLSDRFAALIYHFAEFEGKKAALSILLTAKDDYWFAVKVTRVEYAPFALDRISALSRLVGGTGIPFRTALPLSARAGEISIPAGLVIGRWLGHIVGRSGRGGRFLTDCRICCHF